MMHADSLNASEKPQRQSEPRNELFDDPFENVDLPAFLRRR